MSITELVESPGYKKVMAKVYGWGAAVVLLGALFKIQHYPGAGPMLVIGMGTEIVIFFLSAFEPPHQMPDWSLVYPELVGLEPKETHHGGGGKSKTSGHGGGGELAALIESGHIDPSIVEKLADGVKKLSMTTSQLSDLTEASIVTDSYLKGMRNASESINQFSVSQNNSVKVLEESTALLAQSYDSTAKVITQSGSRLAEDLNTSGKRFVEELNKSSENMTNSYAKLNQSMNQEIERIAGNSKAYADQMEGLNKNLSSINSIYELQLKNNSAQIDVANEMIKGMSDVREQLQQSLAETKSYKDQVAKLSQSIGELNTIYGNMLSAMNSGTR